MDPGIRAQNGGLRNTPLRVRQDVSLVLTKRKSDVTAILIGPLRPKLCQGTHMAESMDSLSQKSRLTKIKTQTKEFLNDRKNANNLIDIISCLEVSV